VKSINGIGKDEKETNVHLGLEDFLYILRKKSMTAAPVLRVE
jgi:hypothetical protein